MFRNILLRVILISLFLSCLFNNNVIGQSNDYKTALKFLLNQPCGNFITPLKTLADTNATAKNTLNALTVQIQNSDLDVRNINTNLYEGERASVQDNGGIPTSIMHGNGLLITPNHNCYAGRFVSDKFFNGIALQTADDCKSLYLGNIKGSQFDGNGIQMFKDSLIMIGTFETNVFKYGTEVLFNKNCSCYNKVQIVDTILPLIKFNNSEVAKPDSIPNRTSTYFDQLPEAHCDTLRAIIYKYDLKKYLIGYFNYTIPKQSKHDYNFRDLDINNMIEDFYIGGLKNENQSSEIRHGKGFLITLNWNYYYGVFRNNKFYEGWEYVEDDSYQTIYAGKIEEFKKHGSGFMITKSGACYYGNFKNDEFISGKMCRFNPETNLLEYGRFSNGKFHPHKKMKSLD